MTQRFLEVTFRKGRPFAAYLYLPRQPGDVSARTQRLPSGLVIDFAADGRAIGVEIPSPTKTTMKEINEALATAQQDLATAEELSPLKAAA